MKKEQRVLSTTCRSNICIGLIYRGLGRDAIIAATSCRELCERVKNQGFMGELRFQEGDCDCGLQQYPGKTPALEEARLLASRLIEWISIASDP